MADHRGRPVVGAGFGELGTVDDARDDLAHVHRLAIVQRHRAGQLVGRVQRLERGVGINRAGRAQGAPLQALEQLARDAQRIGIVLGQVLAQAGDAGVHHRTAQLLVGGHLAGGGLQQRRPGQEGLGAAAHHDHVVRQPRHVGAAGGGRAVHHADHRNACRRQPGQVVEQLAAVDEAFDLVLQQVGAGRFDQLHEGQLVLHGDVLRAQDLVAAHALDGAGVDAGIVDGDDAARAADRADAGDDAAAGHALLGVGLVDQPAGQRRQLQPRRAGVEQPRQALARQQLVPFVEQRLGLGRGGGGTRFELAQAADQLQHGLALRLEGLAFGMDAGFEDRHGSVNERDFKMLPAARPGVKPRAIV